MITKSLRQSSICLAKLPRAGLGNKLLVWARAWVFAQQHRLPLFVSGWCHLHVGPFLRRQKNRFYWNYFDSRPFSWAVRLLSLGRPRVQEPALDDPQTESDARPAFFVFQQLPHWSDYFAGLREHRDALRQALDQMLKKGLRARLDSQPAPEIGVHVRAGDFRPLPPGELLTQAEHARTPIDYFVQIVIRLRRELGSDVPVTLFSDGKDEELRALLALPNVARAAANPDVVDLQRLARSRIIVCSAGSTFSYWAAFLSDAVVILPPSRHAGALRSEAVSQQWFEGQLEESSPLPALLEGNLATIRRDRQKAA